MSVDLNLMDVFKLPIKIFCAIAFGTGLILFLPDSIVERLYLDSFRDSFGFWLGLVFIISVSIVLITFVVFLGKYFRDKLRLRKWRRKSEKDLNELDDLRMAILCSLYEKINHTDDLPLNDGAVLRLQNAMMISRAANQYAVEDLRNPEFPFMLQPWVIEYLDCHPDLVKKYKEAMERVTVLMEKENEKNGYFDW